MKLKTLMATLSGLALLAIALPASAGSIEGTITAKKKRNVAKTVVYVDGVKGAHPAPADPVEMDQRGSKFVPELLPILKGSTVRYLNNDPTKHNVYTPDGETFDLGEWAQGESKTYKFEKLGSYTHLCKLHPSMLAYIVVLENPHFAVVNKDGTFKIDNVPAGKYKLKVWNPRRTAAAVDVNTSKDVKGLTIPLTRKVAAQ